MFYSHYRTIYFEDFIINIKSLEGRFSEILRLRNLYLNGKRTKYNGDEVKAGKSVCTEKQLQAYNKKIEDKANEYTSIIEEELMSEYEEFLMERKEE